MIPESSRRAKPKGQIWGLPHDPPPPPPLPELRKEDAEDPPQARGQVFGVRDQDKRPRPAPQDTGELVPSGIEEGGLMKGEDEKKLRWAVRTYLALHGWSRTEAQLKKEDRAKRILEKFAYWPKRKGGKAI